MVLYSTSSPIHDDLEDIFVPTFALNTGAKRREWRNDPEAKKNHPSHPKAPTFSTSEKMWWNIAEPFPGAGILCHPKDHPVMYSVKIYPIDQRALEIWVLS